jgi:hypothetical protein
VLKRAPNVDHVLLFKKQKEDWMGLHSFARIKLVKRYIPFYYHLKVI